MLHENYLKSMFLAVLLVFSIASVAHADYPADALDKKIIIQLLKDQKFDHLDKVLTRLQTRYEQGHTDELEVAHAFRAFANSDPELDERLKTWLMQKPDSFAAHLAVAEYNLGIGWHARGTRWSKDTEKKQFAKMQAYFRVAAENYTQASRLNPKLTLAYWGMIRLSYGLGGQGLTKQVMQQGLQADPASYLIHYQYMWSLQPKWGGSIVEMKKHLETVRQYYSTNPRLRNLEAFPDYVLADGFPWNECKKATPHFNMALGKGDLPYVYKERAESYRCVKSNKAAISDYTKAIVLQPQSPRYLQSRGYMYYQMKEYQKALTDLDEAIELDRMHPKALLTRGRVYYQLKKPDDALRDLNDALNYGSQNKKTHIYLGYVYYYQKKNYVMAVSHLKEAIALGENNPATHYLLAAALWHEQDCNFVGTANDYVQLCVDNRKCKNENVEWAQKSVEHAIARGICPQK